MRQWKLTLLLGPLIAIAAGCAYNARLQDVESGQLLRARFHWNQTDPPGGAVKLQMPSGETRKGTHTTLVGRGSSWGVLYDALYGGKEFASGSAKYGERTMENMRRGTAFITGDRGTVIECEYLAIVQPRPPVPGERPYIGGRRYPDDRSPGTRPEEAGGAPPVPTASHPTGHGACRDNRGRTYRLTF